LILLLLQERCERSLKILFELARKVPQLGSGPFAFGIIRPWLDATANYTALFSKRAWVDRFNYLSLYAVPPDFVLFFSSVLSLSQPASDFNGQKTAPRGNLGS
jgi:hypothetical protein